MYVRGGLLSPDPLSVLKAVDVRREVSKVCVYCWYLMGGIFNQVKGHGKHV